MFHCSVVRANMLPYFSWNVTSSASPTVTVRAIEASMNELDVYTRMRLFIRLALNVVALQEPLLQLIRRAA